MTDRLAQVLELLRQPRTATQIAGHLGLTRTRVSQILRQLRADGLATVVDREGKRLTFQRATPEGGIPPRTPVDQIVCACGCGGLRDRVDPQGRPRRYVRNHHLNPPTSGKVADPVWRAERSARASLAATATFEERREAIGDTFDTKGLAYQAGYRAGYSNAMHKWRRKFRNAGLQEAKAS